MIRLNKVSKTYRTDKVETLALKDIDLHVREGEFVAMMGPSGCGKSNVPMKRRICAGMRFGLTNWMRDLIVN